MAARLAINSERENGKDELFTEKRKIGRSTLCSAKLNIFAPLVDGPSQSVYLMKSEVFTILNELMHTREEGKVEMRRIWGGEGWLVGCTHCNFV